MKPRTLIDKVWDHHVVYAEPGRPALLYIDVHLVHEVTSPQAFEGLRLTGRALRRPDRTFATMDHAISTTSRQPPTDDPIALQLVQALERSCHEFDVPLFDLQSPDQGIVHVIGPELGLTQPGFTIVCGDSHTATHGAFGALAFGIGTSEVEHVFATQCLQQFRPQTFEIEVSGRLPRGVTAKDLILGIIGRLGTDGATGAIIEYTGEAIRDLSMEQRMTVCNMSIEAGARAGMIAPDETTFSYLEGRRYVPTGDAFGEAVEQWRRLASDDGAQYDRRFRIDAGDLAPQVTWGTSPGMVAPITGVVPDPDELGAEDQRKAAHRALRYMDLEPGTPLRDISVDRVFIGSCTNSRIEDLRQAAAIVRGHHVATGVHAMVVPGSHRVKVQAEEEGLAQVFVDAGFEWRGAGCSMCLGTNDDRLAEGERCASTSNRNFEGRQGRGGRTHLVSPPMAAAAAIAGHFVDIREWDTTDIMGVR